MQTVTPKTPPTNRLWKGLAAAAAVAGIVIVVGALVLATPGGDEIEPIALTPTTATQAPPTTQASLSEDEPFTEDGALAVADAFAASYDAGDFEALVPLFAGNGEGSIAEGFEEEASDLADAIRWQEQLRAWNVAQGTTRSATQCGVSGGPAVFNVRCTYEESQALHLAVDAPPTPVVHILLVTSEGITLWSHSFEQPDYNVLNRPFNRWTLANHPEVAAAADFGNWTSVEEAEEFGRIRAEYAQQWAAYLIANGCTYEDGEC